MQRPSIVALPVYPSPSSNGQAAKLNRFKRALRFMSWLTVLVANAATGVYLGKRAEAVILVESKMPAVFVGAWCFLVLEIIVAVFVGEFLSGCYVLKKLPLFQNVDLLDTALLSHLVDVPRLYLSLQSNGAKDEATR
jgi:hypothetical protein